MPKRKKRSFFLPVKSSDKVKQSKVTTTAAGDLSEEIDSDNLSDLDTESKRQEDKKKVKKPELVSEETPQEKRLRLAKQYISELGEVGEPDHLEQDGFDSIGERLQQEALEQSGRLYRQLSDVIRIDPTPSHSMGAHKGSITALVLSPDETVLFSACKDAVLIKWDLRAAIRLTTFNDPHRSNIKQYHSSRILSLAVSSDGKLLASGGTECKVEIWNVSSCEHIHTFSGHKGAVTGLTFRRGSCDLYSASVDRTVKVWNAESLTYVETLFGHESAITGIDSLHAERAVTSGGLDRSLRVWKIAEETQLLYQSSTSAIDCIKFVTKDMFVAGSQDGSIYLWGVTKKRPLFVQEKAHEGWISSLYAVSSSDVIISGSNDGYVRIWKLDQSKKSLELIHSLPVTGFVNSILMTYNGDKLIIGAGREHRLGRWFCDKSAKNVILILEFNQQT
ncbi:U3 small nucleolar RNA-interacting protein 2 isoform X2 [Oopsacas minuta]|uniref:U3 small nucleolar RNA-interacting protein 2 isoform X2 n=1 Tax=Oopsacas minuta TaxID=111878 RepID=A0AAV7K2S6_9METZ|nr:U3 small nucleolar RNA-interacting protein 2 isoform X2 [Oopsacas minuta]